MKKITPKKIFFVIIGIFLIAIFWRFAHLLSFPDSSIVLKKGEFIKIRPEESVTQKFTASHDGMMKVEVLLRGSGIKYENGDRMEMLIADENCNGALHQGELTRSFLDSSNLYEFSFPRIAESENKNYCLIATFKPKKDSAKSIQFFTMGNEKNQPLSIRPVYKNKYFWQDISELNRRISQYKPWFLKHYYLYAVAFGFLIFSIFLVAILILI